MDNVFCSTHIHIHIYRDSIIHEMYYVSVLGPVLNYTQFR